MPIRVYLTQLRTAISDRCTHHQKTKKIALTGIKKSDRTFLDKISDRSTYHRKK
ncbi:MAG: hypothetical protein V7K98_02475 [Nostoc sp.]|uniref:hypothetical protein n=1 Tax=Nostoc sp. TaxID=1180 RepID=UPI002FF43F19